MPTARPQSSGLPARDRDPWVGYKRKGGLSLATWPPPGPLGLLMLPLAFPGEDPSLSELWVAIV